MCYFYLNASKDTMRKDGKNMRPRLFDVRANDVSNEGVPVIKPWKRFVLDPDYAGAWIVAGDVDGDGQVEIVSAKNVDKNDNHYTSSVVVHRLDGSVLWRWGNPSEGRNKLHHDVACQIYDWDVDGKAKVVIATREAIVALDGATGKEKRRFAIPRNAADCIVFANLSGEKRASDILVKTRYGQIWAFNRDGKLLWTIKEPGGYKTAHQPRVIDIDRDGRDEIMAGYAMLNPDGTIRWELKGQGLGFGRGHLDCARVFDMGKRPLDSSVILTFCGGNRIAKVDGTGNIIWSVTGHHFESVNVGKVCADVPGKQIVVDIDHRPWDKSPLWVLDEHGNLLGQIITDGSRHHALIDWFGRGVESIVMGTAAAMFDGRGNKVAMFDASAVGLCSKGDMTGNGVPDLIFSSNPASEICIFKNEKGEKPEGKVALGTGINFTLY
jgi:outer membrane protein assembly factor BamB